jgi:hypothetical protein
MGSGFFSGELSNSNFDFRVVSRSPDSGNVLPFSATIWIESSAVMEVQSDTFIGGFVKVLDLVADDHTVFSDVDMQGTIRLRGTGKFTITSTLVLKAL